MFFLGGGFSLEGKGESLCIQTLDGDYMLRLDEEY